VKNKVLVILMLLIITVINIINLQNYESTLVYGLGRAMLLFFMITFMVSILNIKLLYRTPLIVSIVTIFGIFSISTTFVNMEVFDEIIEVILSPLIDLTYWVSAFLFSYIIVKNQASIVKFASTSFYLSIPVIAYFYFIVALYFNSFGAKNYQGINAAYYLLLLLPFILMMKNNILKLLGIATVTIALFMSTKRTGIIALAISLIAYYILNVFSKENKRKSKLISIIAILLAGAAFTVLFIYISDQTGGYLLNRFTTIEQDEGSGRTDIWINTINLQLDSNALGWLIGHGYNSVANTFVGYSAHNDFLEVLYDYGIIGFSLYVVFYVQLIGIGKKMYRYNYRYLNSFAISCILLFVLSLFSHLIIYPTYFIYLSFFWGMTIADFENINSQKINQMKMLQYIRSKSTNQI